MSLLAVIDKQDLMIIGLLAINCRVSYRKISRYVNLTPNAVKNRINKMISNGIIKNFVVRVNPAILGYDKECFLTINNMKKIKQKDIINKLNLVGEVSVYAKQLGGVSISLISLKPGSDEKIKLLHKVLEPAIIEKSMIVDNKPISLKIRTIDLKIIRCLLNNPRMSTTEIAKSTSISSKSVIRWLRKMEDNDMLNFTIIRDISSMQLVGYIEFAMIIKIDKQYLKNLTRMIIDDMKEYLLFMPHLHDTDMIFAVFFCANIPTVDLIFSNLETSIGVIHIEIFITTDLSFYQEWIFNAIEKKLIS